MNTKKLYVNLAAVLFSMGAAAQTTYISEDFSNGIPADFTLIDRDGYEPSADMQKLGFAVGIPWIGLTTSSGEQVACSTSWYKSSHISNDWMILPSFVVNADTDVLSWRSMAYDKKYSDGFKVMIATNTDDPVSLPESEWTELYYIGKEQPSWQHHVVSLAEYTGKRVSIAFVNNSDNCSRLFVDDIYAGRQTKVFLRSAMSPVVFNQDNAHLSVEAYTFEESPVRGFTLKAEIDGQVITQDFPDAELTADQPVTFTFDATLPLGFGVNKEYTITAKTASDEVSMSRNICNFHHRIVAEELTGTWCGFCIRGIVMMQNMKELYPDEFLPINVHVNDVMTCSDYLEPLEKFMGDGLPAMTINRDKDLAGDPSNCPNYADMALQHRPDVCFSSLSAMYDAASDAISIKSSTIANAAVDGTVAYAIVEDSVCQPGNNDYSQTNYYADNAYGEMGGFENLPEHISDFTFREVARGLVYADSDETESSDDAFIRSSQSVSCTLPGNILEKGNVYIVAMIFNAEGKIINAELLSDIEGLTDGIENVDFDSQIKTQDSQLYNISGVHVNDSYKGIIIQNGKCYLQK